MLTYNTKYANNSNMHVIEDGLEHGIQVSISKGNLHQYQHQQQQSTPFEELNGFEKRVNKRQSKVLSEAGNLLEYRKSKQYQSQNELAKGQTEESESPLLKKMDVKQNRKCRRSNTTFTLAGMKKNRIIDYFNNLEMTKPVSSKNINFLASGKEINMVIFKKAFGKFFYCESYIGLVVK